MSDTVAANGACLCGAIKVHAAEASTEAGACHCSMCRRWGGGPFLEVNCGARVEFEGGEHIGIFDSSDWAERGFCRRCGTHLFYRIKSTGQHMVPVGLFDDLTVSSFTTQVFIDEKPPYYRFANETRNMTGAEIFAMFGASDES